MQHAPSPINHPTFTCFRFCRLWCCLPLLLLASARVPAGEPTTKPEGKKAIRLFDGKTLDGWEGNTQIFRVIDGAIVAGTLKERIAHNEFLTTQRQFENFDLRLEAKLQGQGQNAGVQFRSQRIPDHHEVIGYQCDMGQMRDKNIWGWLYDESRRRKFLAEAKAPENLNAKFQANDWNRLRIRCQGPRIQIWVNDVMTVDYEEKQEDISRKGIIALQIHGGPPALASYRNITLTILDAP